MTIKLAWRMMHALVTATDMHSSASCSPASLHLLPLPFPQALAACQLLLEYGQPPVDGDEEDDGDNHDKKEEGGEADDGAAVEVMSQDSRRSKAAFSRSPLLYFGSPGPSQ